MAPLFGLRWAVPLALLSGLTMWLAFSPVAFGPYAIASVALLTAAAWRSTIRRGVGLGLLSGLVFFLLLLGWMRVVGTDAWLLLALYCAAWFALVGGATALVTRLPAAPAWVASVWVLEEALRGRVPWGGFPWGNIAFAQPDTSLLNYAAIGGAPFLSFVVAFIGASLVTGALDYRAGLRRWSAAWFSVAAALILIPALVSPPTDGDDVGGPDSAVIALVQGGTPQFGMGAMDVRRAVLDNHVAQTLDLAVAIDAGRVPRPDFVLWPENSSDIDPFTDPSAADAITSAARAVGVPILVGAVISIPDDPMGVWNVGIVWDPVLGPQEMYIKTHPVPFGEYIPFREFLSERIGRLDRIPRDYRPGDRPGNLDIGGVAVGNVICFEIAYGEVVDAVIDGGARVITVQTNNATYGGTPQPEQQLAIERVRATEFGRSVVVAATSGISAVIAPDSTVVQRLDEGEEGWLVQEVPLRGQLTLAARIGHVVELLLCAVALAAVAVAAVSAWSTRRRRRAIA